MTSFDAVANSYEKALTANLRFIPGGVDYYYENRAKLARELRSDPPETRSILDFGGGVGLATPHIQKQFPGANIFIFDTSGDSVAQAITRYPILRPVQFTELTSQKFDLILVAGVIHHIEPDARRDILETLRDALSPEGTICVFELNPLNPVTRRLVASCPFDEDASLISRRRLISDINAVEGLRVTARGYTVFFPPIFGMLRPIERLLRWLPLGAQYFLSVEAA